MEVYIQKLLVNQQNENQIREEREMMLKRHERELEDIDERMANIFDQRNMIIKEFQNYLEGNNINTQNLNLLDEVPSSPNSIKLKTSLNSAFKPVTTIVPSSSKKTEPKDPSPDKQQKDIVTTTNNELKMTNETETESENATKTTKEKSKPNRTLKLMPRLKTSNSMFNMSLSSVPESPTSAQIDIMLSKVRENIMDNNTLNKCIDLLSKSRVTKTKDISEEVPVTEESKETIKEDEIKCPNEQLTMEIRRQPSSPKKRIETPEERKRRIERVLFETPFRKDNLSKSASSLNGIDLVQNKQQNSRSSLSLNRYVNRSKVRRNHSLSPLRFGIAKKKSDEQSDTPGSPTENSPREMRKYKSEQQLFFEDSSLASLEEDSTNNDLSSELDPDKSSIQPEEEDDDEQDQEPEDHLLAPSKVVKSQEAFKQIFFPVDLREKPLMSKEELAKIKSKKSMVKSKSIGWNSETNNDQSLRVDYLSHLRRSSASPEQKLREKELNQLNNTRKFRCYQDFWENKTKEIINKNKKFEECQINKQRNKINKEKQELGKKNVQSDRDVIGHEKATNHNTTVVESKESKIMFKPITTTNRIENKVPSKDMNCLKIEIQNSVPKSISKNNNNNKLSVPEENVQKSPSPNHYSDSDNEKLIEKLRYFKQDIRRQKMKQQMKEQQQPESNILRSSPNKSLDLQYLTKHNRIFWKQPNIQQQLPELSNRNRIKLVRSYSREDKELNERMEKISPPVSGEVKMNNWRNGSNHSVSLDQSSAVPMRSTYF